MPKNCSGIGDVPEMRSEEETCRVGVNLTPLTSVASSSKFRVPMSPVPHAGGTVRQAYLVVRLRVPSGHSAAITSCLISVGVRPLASWNTHSRGVQSGCTHRNM